MASNTGYIVLYNIYDWGTGNDATVVVTIQNNGGVPIDGWTLAWNFPGDQSIINMWEAHYTQIGNAVTASNLFYNGTISAGSPRAFGFNLKYTGSNDKPTYFTLNGQPCQALVVTKIFKPLK